MGKSETIKIAGQNLELTNLDKLFFPKTKFRKGDVLDYYREISAVLLPHLKDRPITMKRFPDGITGRFFYEKEAPKYTPEWIDTFAVKRKEKRAGDDAIDYIVINNAASLLWTVNMANIEMHALLARTKNIEQPTYVVFDLDPGAPANVLQCSKVALELKTLFEGLGLESFVKVSGSKGLQVYIPLNGSASYEVTRPFAQTVAELMQERMAELVVSKMTKSIRGGKVLIDWSQNDDFKTTVIVYSLRAKSAEPYISAPVEWKELSDALKRGKPELLYFSPKEALQRVEKKGDLFSPLLKLKQKLPAGFVHAVDENNAPTKNKKSTSTRRKINGTDMDAYRAKRDFSKTKEPPPEVRKSRAAVHRFVIQKHAASHLHYDFRLEMDGVLRSWAVPKGPSTKKGERRLAMHVEDHPLDYADFEGTISPGNYGAGTVMVWDRGTYTTGGGNPGKDYREGKLHLVLNGEKLKGEWALVGTGDDKKWFLIKVGKDAKAVSTKRDDQSVITGRTMAKIAKENTAVWKSNKMSARRPSRSR